MKLRVSLASSEWNMQFDAQKKSLDCKPFNWIKSHLFLKMAAQVCGLCYYVVTGTMLMWHMEAEVFRSL